MKPSKSRKLFCFTLVLSSSRPNKMHLHNSLVSLLLQNIGLCQRMSLCLFNSNYYGLLTLIQPDQCEFLVFSLPWQGRFKRDSFVIKIALIQHKIHIIIIIIMKIIYIAPNPLKGSRRFTKSVTATLQFTEQK